MSGETGPSKAREQGTHPLLLHSHFVRLAVVHRLRGRVIDLVVTRSGVRVAAGFTVRPSLARLHRHAGQG